MGEQKKVKMEAGPFPLGLADAIIAKGKIKGEMLEMLVRRLEYLERQNTKLDFQNRDLKERNETLRKAFKELSNE